jgi:hypothetical protein
MIDRIPNRMLYLLTFLSIAIAGAPAAIIWKAIIY